MKNDTQPLRRFGAQRACHCGDIGADHGRILPGRRKSWCRFSTGCALVGLMLLSACGSGPPPKLYLLEPLQPIASLPPSVTSSTGIGLLGMSAVILPGYATNTQIASIGRNGTVVQDDDHRWAEEPEDAITRVLSDRLRERASTTVLLEPWPRDYNPAARVEVVFDRLLREPLGGADMVGQILLLSGDGRKLLRNVPFQIIHYGRDTKKSTFFMAISQGIDDIARMAVQALQELNSKS